MPIFEIQHPDGRSFEVDAPDMQAAVGAISSLGGAPQRSSATDIAASLLGPVGQGVNLLAKTVVPEAMQEFSSKLGRFGQKVYESPPPSLAAPKQFFETAQNITAGNEFNPADVLSMGMAGRFSPAVPARFGGITTEAPRSQPKEMPAQPARLTSAELADVKTTGYKTAKNETVEIQPTFMHDAYNKILAELSEKFEPTQAQGTFAILRRAAEESAPAPKPKSITAEQFIMGTGGTKEKPPVTSNRVEAFRQQLGDIKPSPTTGGSDAFAAKLAQQKLDEIMGSLPKEAVISGDPVVLKAAIEDARANNAAMERMKILEATTERANLQGGKTSDTRTAFRQLSRPSVRGSKSLAQLAGFNAAEQQAIRAASQPGVFGALGKLAPGGIMGGFLHGAANVTLPYIMPPITAASLGAKFLGNKATAAKVERAFNLAAERSPLYRQQRAKFERDFADYLEAGRRGGLLPPMTALPYGASQGILQLLPQ